MTMNERSNKESMDQVPIETARSRFPLQTVILIANLLLLGFIAIYLVTGGVGNNEVVPVVLSDPKTRKQLEQLEQALQRNPGDIARALELAHVYQDIGEFPWSYDALKNAERHGSQDLDWRMKLGLAYLELGKNDDALRVLKDALKRCEKETCQSPLQAKLGIFTRIVQLFKERGIDSRRNRLAAEIAMREVLKPIKVDLEKLRPKAPAPAPDDPAAPSGDATPSSSSPPSKKAAKSR